MIPRSVRVLFMVGGIALLGVADLSLAAQDATFRDGRSLRIAAYHVEGNLITLELEGGGRITLPRERIRTIREVPALEGEERLSARETAIFPPSEKPSTSDSDTKEGSENDLFAQIAELALKYRLESQLVAAIALVESGFDPEAVSPKGARGLMQLMPATAAEYGVEDSFNPLENLEAGITHLRHLLDRYQGDLELALAAYNAGEGAVARYGGVPPFPETIRYVSRVLALARSR